MEVGYVKGDSTNLPRINSLMVGRFFAVNPDFCSAELRNVKTSISGRETYGDDAIGYVQLKREQNVCTVKCTVCTEHKVRSKPYAATLVVDEQEEVVISVKCHDCPASAGGWCWWLLHRRSEGPSCTSVECYWKKSNLAKVGTSIKILSAREMAKRKPKVFAPDSGLMNEFVKECKTRKINNCPVVLESIICLVFLH
ncbi:unnamed protein product [Plutella xylostella]|uniref:(diamondback moth) hypothetical protein n=1 Tax=Plutella xylostella TaxID=51655 RepID=A0A8S4FCF2_PLUXY|nr:unnamed protein product [Plutella xylostella]